MVGEGEEEEENIPGMHLLAAGTMGGDKWFSVGGSAAWRGALQRKHNGAVPADTGTDTGTGDWHRHSALALAQALAPGALARGTGTGSAHACHVAGPQQAGSGALLLDAVELPLRPSSGIVAPAGPSLMHEGTQGGAQGPGSRAQPAGRRPGRDSRRSRAPSAEAQAQAQAEGEVQVQGLLKTVSMTAHAGVPEDPRGAPDGAAEEVWCPRGGYAGGRPGPAAPEDAPRWSVVRELARQGQGRGRLEEEGEEEPGRDGERGAGAP